MSHGAPAIGDYGLISDGASVALVSNGGSIDWCCMPRLDRGSCFGRILDPDAGHCSIRVLGAEERGRAAYEEGTMVLTTTFTTGDGEAKLSDCFLLDDDSEEPSGGSRLLRVVEAIGGEVELDIELVPRFDYGEVDPWIRRHASSVYSIIGGDDGIIARTDDGLKPEGSHALRGATTLAEGERFRLLLTTMPPERIDEAPLAALSGDEIDGALERTTEAWRSWSKRLRFDGPGVEAVRRSALVLRALSHERTGAVAAAPTTSLPEGLGGKGERNWDYRYSWVRDSTLAVRSLAQVGFEEEADAFRRFIERSAAGNAHDLQVVFGVGGERRLHEIELDHLEGYRGATPVRVGNGAARQLQLDSYGLVLEQSWRWLQRGHEIDDEVWHFLFDLVEAAIERWPERDCGFWEARSPRHFTHSKSLCWAAVDRGLRIAAEEGRDVPLDRWESAREEIRAQIDESGVDRDRGVFVRDFGSRDLDAALLRLPTVDFCPWDDERMVRTADAIAEDLDFGGLLRRYDVDDGFDVEEGAFLSCSFWLAECYARQGRVDEAQRAFERTMETANELGLFSEEYDPRNDEMLGNFPQGLSHLSHIEAALALAEAEA